MQINHLIDPTYFYDAIEEFAFNYVIYVLTGKTLDEYGETKNTYMKTTIRGSLQTQGLSLNQEMSGNVYKLAYNFYCKSLYRINIGDVIKYQNNYLRVISMKEYDGFGVRSCSLEMIQLSAYRDLAEYIKFIEGEELV